MPPGRRGFVAGPRYHAYELGRAANIPSAVWCGPSEASGPLGGVRRWMKYGHGEVSTKEGARARGVYSSQQEVMHMLPFWRVYPMQKCV